MQLDKPQSRQRCSGMRALWSRWNPIGVMTGPDRPRDEYDASVGGTLCLLEQGVSVRQLVTCLDACVTGAMGLGGERLDVLRPQCFAEAGVGWYRRCWPDTTVPGS